MKTKMDTPKELLEPAEANEPVGTDAVRPERYTLRYLAEGITTEGRWIPIIDGGRIIKGSKRLAQDEMQRIVAHYSAEPKYGRIGSLSIRPTTEADENAADCSFLRCMFKPFRTLA